MVTDKPYLTSPAVIKLWDCGNISIFIYRRSEGVPRPIHTQELGMGFIPISMRYGKSPNGRSESFGNMGRSMVIRLGGIFGNVPIL